MIKGREVKDTLKLVNNKKLLGKEKISDISEVLQSLGLSKYAARGYVSLILTGASKGGVLSKTSGVPRTKIYTSLKKLIERGLAYKLSGRPYIFFPNSPSKSFEGYLSQYEDETSNKMASLTESKDAVFLLEKIYNETQFNVYFQRAEGWIVNNQNNIIEKMRELLTQASKGISLITTKDGFHFFNTNFNKLLKKLDKRGINIEIGIPTKISTHEFKYKLKHITLDKPLLFLDVKDQAFFLMNLNNKDTGFFSDNPKLRSFFSLMLPKFID